MFASRVGFRGAPGSTRFWLGAFCIALMPTSIGYQDLAAMMAHRSGAASLVSEHLIASPFGTIEAATFNFTRPTGTAMPDPLGFQVGNFDPRSLDAYAWKIDEVDGRAARQIEYPSVNRAHKGDRLTPADTPSAAVDAQRQSNAAAPDQAVTAQPPVSAMAVHQEADVHQEMNAHSVEAAAPAVVATADAAAEPLSGQARADIRLADKPPETPTYATGKAPASLTDVSFIDGDSVDRSAQIYFGGGAMGSPSALQSWAPGAEPIMVPPSEDSGIKLSALEGGDADTGGGETIAGKDDASRMASPAQRLGLSGEPRAHAEKCLADAVYFEARGEVLKGQEAVAQVVMNRVFSGYYPHDVCGVVYQNANRHLACQFTFACEGKDLNKIDEPDMWEQAQHIAKDMLDGKIWLPEVGHATHYHAYWVHPSWVHEMARLYHLGVHTFYRPLNWGDGDDEPVWGNAAPSAAPAPSGKSDAASPTSGEAAAPEASAAPAKSAQDPGKSPDAAAPPAAAVGNDTPTAKL
jgi:hypothetical protein